MARRFSAHWTFLRQFRRHFHTTGSVLPSSRFLAAELARYVREGGTAGATEEPRRVLEVGPGTGAVTEKIVACLKPGDRLDLVELNDEFVALLRRRFDDEPGLKAVADRVRILHQPVEELTAGEPYDRIISGLPLNNFSVDDVERILGRLEELLVPGGRLSFFEYSAIRVLRSMVSRRAGRERLRGVRRAIGRLLQRGESRRKLIWLNFPPAWVHHLMFPAESGHA